MTILRASQKQTFRPTADSDPHLIIQSEKRGLSGVTSGLSFPHLGNHPVEVY